MSEPGLVHQRCSRLLGKHGRASGSTPTTMRQWRRLIRRAAETATKISTRSSTSAVQKMLEPPLSGDGKDAINQTRERGQP